MNDRDDPVQCDRRGSRAARSLLMNKTIPILQHYSNYPLPKNSNRDHHDYMQLYKIFISDLMTNPAKCILNPKSDIYWNEELHYSTQPSRYKKQRIIHKCATCGKTFISRFYLDQHMENKHKHDLVLHHHQGRICPANEICKLLGGSLCDRQSLKDEPHYAPGIYDSSNTDKLSAQSIQRKYQNQIDSQPCDPQTLQISREFCRDSIMECFAGMDDLMNEMDLVLCETHNCRHHLEILHSVKVTVHDIKAEWDRHANELNRFGLGFILLSLAGLAWIIWKYGSHWLSRSRRKGKQRKIDMGKRKRL